MPKPALTGYTVDQLETLCLEWKEKKYRARQLFKWLHLKNASSFEAMTDLSEGFRATLTEKAVLSRLQLVARKPSPDGLAEKYLFRLHDGQTIESVLIREPARKTVCLSSQVGCPLGCTFCATGYMGIVRNLKTDEIVEQVLHIRRAVKEEITNLVYMGMGEPFLNYDSVMTSAGILSDDLGYALAKRRITISTAGYLPGIHRFIADRQKYRLALSLTATTDPQRSRLIPINKQYPIAQLLESAVEYNRVTRRKITLEYTLIKGVNDSPQDARRLIKLVRGLRCKINLIPFNPIGNDFERPGSETIDRFFRILNEVKLTVTIRWSRGDSVNAACGQLATRTIEKQPERNTVAV